MNTLIRGRWSNGMETADFVHRAPVDSSYFKHEIFQYYFSNLPRMSSRARSFFRSSHLSRHRKLSRKQRHKSAEHAFLPSEWTTGMILQPQPMNVSCCGGDAKKKSAKKQVQAPHLKQELAAPPTALLDPVEPSDHKIQVVTQQQAVRVAVADDVEDLYGKKDVTKAMIQQLAQRALTAPMNSNNDDPPRLCTKKHVSASNRCCEKSTAACSVFVRQRAADDKACDVRAGHRSEARASLRAARVSLAAAVALTRWTFRGSSWRINCSRAT